MSHPDLQTRVTNAAAAFSFIAAVFVVLLSHVEHTRSIRPSTLLVVYLLFSSIFNAAQNRTLFLARIITSIPKLMTASLGLNVLLLALEAQDKRSYLKNPCRTETTSGIINWSFFWWLNGLFQIGYRKIMNWDDLYMIDENLDSQTLGERLQSSWDKEGPTFRYP